jgi:hypothetical protein
VKDRRISRSGITPYPMVRYRSRHRKRHDAHVLQQLEKGHNTRQQRRSIHETVSRIWISDSAP